MLKKIILIVLMLVFSITNVFAITIDDPFISGEGYSVTGTGSIDDPYRIKLIGENNCLSESALTHIKENSEDSMWMIEHYIDEKNDYSFRFSSSIIDCIQGTFDLDLIYKQNEEGIVDVIISEKDSSFLPISLIMDVSNFEGFEEGDIVTVSGNTRAKVQVIDNKIDIPIDKGGNHVLTVLGYEKEVEYVEEERPSDEVWDTANENGIAITDDYVNAGSSELPFNFDMTNRSNTFVGGKMFNELSNNKQSCLFLYKGDDSKISWSYLVSGSKCTPVDNDEKFDLETTFDGTNIHVACPYKFPCRMKMTIHVGDYFNDAIIVDVKGKQCKTSVVVDRGYITFWIEEGGKYLVSDTGETVESLSVNDAKLVSDKSRDNMYTMKSYKGSEFGTIDDPLVILGKLDDFFWASWRSMNTIAGYSSEMNVDESTYNPNACMHVSIENRSFNTGKLISSILINGNEWRMTPEDMKGPYYLDYKLNPSKSIIENVLDAHSLYTGKYAERKEGAIEVLTSYAESEEDVLFLMSRTRAFAGAINYKLDMSKYFERGDILTLKYILGSANGDMYHGRAQNNAELLLEENSYTKYDCKVVVDSFGYISFPLYTGGFYCISKTGETEAVVDTLSLNDDTDVEEKESARESKISKKIQKNEIKMIEENVAAEKHNETGVLVETKLDEFVKKPNYSKKYKNSYVEGYLKDDSVDLFIEINEYALNVKLKKQSGFNYRMNADEYFDITVNLGSNYSIHDENKLYIKYIEGKKITSEAFSTNSEIDQNGDMQFTFRTSHVGDFEIFHAENQEELANAISLKQEYTSEATTMLAERSVEKNDSNKTIKYILMITLSILIILIIITEIRRKSVNEK